MSSDENKALVTGYFEAYWARGEEAAMDAAFAPDMVDHNPLPGQGPGLAGMRDALTAMLAGLRIEALSLDQVLAESDLVGVVWSARIAHVGPFFGVPATGKVVPVRGIDVHRVRDGKIVELWHNEDILGLLAQIGALPTPG